MIISENSLIIGLKGQLQKMLRNPSQKYFEN